MRLGAAYEVQGAVIDAGTNLPLENIHVRAYDKDLVWDDCLGAALTDERGTFSIPFFARDFREPFEGEPELYLVLYGHGRTAIERTDILRWPAGQRRLAIRLSIDAGQLGDGPRVVNV